MNASNFREEHQAVEAQIRKARENIAGLEGQVRDIERELHGLFGQRQRFQVLTDICASLDQLESLGAAHLFWGEESASEKAKEHVARARGQAAQFLETIAGIEQRRKTLQEKIEDELLNIDSWNMELARLFDQEERKKSEFLVERDISTIPYRPMVMPWDPDGDDAKRLRKYVLLALLISISLGSGMSFWTLPPVARYAPVEMPKNIVKLVKNEKPKAPPPPQKLAPKKPEEPKPEELAKAPTPTKEKPATAKATKAEIKAARSVASGSGVLKFSKQLSDMLASADEPKLGLDAKVGADVRKAGGGSLTRGLSNQRNIIASQAAAGGSGGINVAGLSRDIGTGGGHGGGRGNGTGGIGGVRIARVTDTIGGGGGGGGGNADRPLSNGPGPSRTDEEIQIVFDRYKAALYRIYNRELRNDPTLRGKMVLRITIEPDGSVSMCRVEKTDLASAALSAEVVNKVKMFNFGAKEKVRRLTILYPIDFLPAT